MQASHHEIKAAIEIMEGDKRTGSDKNGFYIRTFTGKQFYFDDIANNVIDIEDIAHALSMACRWSGHTRKFYSVAEHSVRVGCQARYLGERHCNNNTAALQGLLHDATEAYLHDCPSPLKWHLRDKGFTAYDELEKAIDKRIFDALNIPYPRDPRIKEIDLRMLATEHRDLMPETSAHAERVHMLKPYGFRCECWRPETAEKVFLNLYKEFRR